jgi:hypothetical protein
MFTQKLSFPAVLVAALAVATAAAFVALVHAYGDMRFFW